MTERIESMEFAVYLAPDISPLSERELSLIALQTANLLGCKAQEIRPVQVALKSAGEMESEFSFIPGDEQSRDPYLALLVLLRSGARALGDRCCILVSDIQKPYPVLDYLKGLAEITRLPVFLGVCRQSTEDTAQRDILVRQLR